MYFFSFDATILVNKDVYMPTLENKMLSYRRETALQGALVLAKSGRLELAKQ